MNTTATETNTSKDSLIGFLIIAGVLYFAYAWFTAPSLERVVVLGEVRFASCDFVGGLGYDCIAKNYGQSSSPRLRMMCASFDSNDRMIGSPDLVTDLYATELARGEERVVRLYFEKKAAWAVCSPQGDIPYPAALREFMQRKENSKYWSVLSLK